MNKEQQKLIKWYQKNHRQLEWRNTTDPYKIWISEIMLQQTRAEVVKDYYTKFIKAFPNVKALANSSEKKVLQNWTGLGYYSRAKNIHKSAKLFAKSGFPKSWEELIEYPGLGPYSARAISSFSFNENVAVLDGNVIRFLSRKFNMPVQHWKTKARAELQKKADTMVKNCDASLMNQVLIEMGASICLSQNPKCLICPVQKNCKAFKEKTITLLPLKKEKKAREFWSWEIQLIKKANKYALVSEHGLPFLKKYSLFPSAAKKNK